MSNYISLGAFLRTAMNKVALPFPVASRDELGALLRSVREGRGFNRCNLSERGGIPRQEIYDVETGNRHPTPRIATAYANALGLKGAMRDTVLLSCDVIPEDVFQLIKANPQLCEVLRAELGQEG